MRRADRFSAVVILVGSLVLMWAARQLPESHTFGPGPEFLPFWLGALMAGLAVLLFVSAGQRPAAAEAKVFPGLAALLPLGLTVGGLAAYILTLERLGFLLGTGLLTLFLLRAVMRERWGMTLLVAALNAAALQVIFRTLLGVSLPKGPFGF